MGSVKSWRRRRPGIERGSFPAVCMNMTRFTACVLIALSFMVPGQLPAAEGGSARERLEAFTSGLETLEAVFDQKVIGSDGAVQDSSSGYVWLSRPQLFRWEYGGDFPELVVADGSNIWIYDETLEQVTVRDQAEATLNSPLSLLTDPGQLEGHYEIRELGDAGDLLLLELRPRKAESEFERILLGLNEDSLAMMVMEDAFGLRTEIRFSSIRRNPEIDPGRFSFEPPESADVIGDPREAR